MKRVIGLPGDVIEVRNDQLYVNHEVIEEAYLYSNKNKLKKTYEFNGGLLDQLQFLKQDFVMGDNRLISRDSRNGLGLIDKADVLGELAAIYYPFEHMKIMIKVKTKQISVCLVFYPALMGSKTPPQNSAKARKLGGDEDPH